MQHFDAFVPGHFRRQLEVHLAVARYDTNQNAGPVASQYQRFKHLRDIFIELFCHMRRGEMFLIHLVRHQFIRYMRPVQ